MECSLTLNETVQESITLALIRLMNQKPFSQISVTELTKLAGVSRVSFYRNFESREQVLALHINRLYRAFFSSPQIPRVLTGRQEMHGFCLPRFRYIQENKEFFCALCKSNLLSYAFEQLEPELLLCIVGLRGPVDPYYLAGVMGSCVGIIRLWVDNGFDESVESIVEKYLAQGSFWGRE